MGRLLESVWILPSGWSRVVSELKNSVKAAAE